MEGPTPSFLACRLYDHEWSLLGMLDPLREAYIASLVKPASLMCPRCGMFVTDYPSGRRVYSYTRQPSLFEREET